MVGRLNSEFFHELAEVGPGEFPFEGRGDGLIVALEAQESAFEAWSEEKSLGTRTLR